MKLSEKLQLVAEWLKNEDNDLLISAEDSDYELEKFAQSNTLRPYIDALAAAMRAYTVTPWTQEMRQLSDGLVTLDVSNPAACDEIQELVKQVAVQPWGRDPAVNKAATDLWQACEDTKKQAPQSMATHSSETRSPLTIVAEALVLAGNVLENAAEEIAVNEPEVVTSEALDELAAVAESFDASGDELLAKQASVIDAVLEMFATKHIKTAKEVQDEKVDQLKKKYKEPKEINDERNQIAEATKDIEKSPMYKDRRVLSTPLSARSCPDHASSAMARISENTYQCQLDKRIYNYDEGYTLLDGTKVAGSSVSGQTQSLWSNIGNPVFDTRSDRTGQDK